MTFCSHLAMRGAPVRMIQELAGHASITTTMRYMHLTESAVDAAIRLLDSAPLSRQPSAGHAQPLPAPWQHRGNGAGGSAQIRIPVTPLELALTFTGADKCTGIEPV